MDKIIVVVSQDRKGNDVEKSLPFEHAENLLNFEHKRNKNLHKLKDKHLDFKNGKIVLKAEKKQKTENVKINSKTDRGTGNKS